jgi:hypothetical protein
VEPQQMLLVEPDTTLLSSLVSMFFLEQAVLEKLLQVRQEQGTYKAVAVEEAEQELLLALVRWVAMEEVVRQEILMHMT